MDKHILTVSREFGSGGRSIGRAVAEQLHIPYYDKEVIRQVAQKTGFDEQFVAENGEYAPGKTTLSYIFKALGRPEALGRADAMDGLSTTDFLWVIQHQVIADLADHGPCVIVGRCSDFILKDRDDCLHTFIHAGQQYRAQRILRLYGEGEKSPQQRLADKDGRRRANYKYFTGRDWGRCQNYHLSPDSGTLGEARCAELLASLLTAPGR